MPSKNPYAGLTLENAFRKIALDRGLPENYIIGLGSTESGGEKDPLRVLNEKNALGVFQQTPIFRKDNHISAEDSMNPIKAAEVAADAIVKWARLFNNNLSKATVAYNAGPTLVRRYERGEVNIPEQSKIHLLNVYNITYGKTPPRPPGKAFLKLLQTPADAYLKKE